MDRFSSGPDGTRLFTGLTVILIVLGLSYASAQERVDRFPDGKVIHATDPPLSDRLMNIPTSDPFQLYCKLVSAAKLNNLRGMESFCSNYIYFKGLNIAESNKLKREILQAMGNVLSNCDFEMIAGPEKHPQGGSTVFYRFKVTVGNVTLGENTIDEPFWPHSSKAAVLVPSIPLDTPMSLKLKVGYDPKGKILISSFKSMMDKLGILEKPGQEGQKQVLEVVKRGLFALENNDMTTFRDAFPVVKVVGKREYEAKQSLLGYHYLVDQVELKAKNSLSADHATVSTRQYLMGKEVGHCELKCKIGKDRRWYVVDFKKEHKAPAGFLSVMDGNIFVARRLASGTILSVYDDHAYYYRKGEILLKHNLSTGKISELWNMLHPSRKFQNTGKRVPFQHIEEMVGLSEQGNLLLHVYEKNPVYLEKQFERGVRAAHLIFEVPRGKTDGRIVVQSCDFVQIPWQIVRSGSDFLFLRENLLRQAVPCAVRANEKCPEFSEAILEIPEGSRIFDNRFDSLSWIYSVDGTYYYENVMGEKHQLATLKGSFVEEKLFLSSDQDCYFTQPMTLHGWDKESDSWRILSENSKEGSTYLQAVPIAGGSVCVQRSQRDASEIIFLQPTFPGQITPEPGTTIGSDRLRVVMQPELEPGLANVEVEGVELLTEWGVAIPVEIEHDFATGGLTVTSSEELESGHNYFLHVRQDVSVLEEDAIESVVIRYLVERR